MEWPPRYPIVRVDWADAQTFTGWHTAESLAEKIKTSHVEENVTVGYLYHADDYAVLIVQTLTDNEQMAEITRIPRAMIRAIHYFTTAVSHEGPFADPPTWGAGAATEMPPEPCEPEAPAQHVAPIGTMELQAVCAQEARAVRGILDLLSDLRAGWTARARTSNPHEPAKNWLIALNGLAPLAERLEAAARRPLREARAIPIERRGQFQLRHPAGIAPTVAEAEAFRAAVQEPQ